MARPKGVIQKRNESKYWLPVGISLKEKQTDIYNKETKLIFIDNELGEFISTFKALQNAKASTHPNSIKNRRDNTNIERYGGKNPHCSKIVRQKAKKTMKERYGVEHALLKEEFINKSRKTLMNNYNVTSPMLSEELRNRQKQTFINKYGFDNPMKIESIKKDLKKQFLDKYGVDNPGKYHVFQEKALKTMIQNNSILSSKGELEIMDYIKSLGLNCKSGYIGGSKPKQIDIKISEINMGIEYNGVFWHCEGNPIIYPNYHRDKTIAAKEQGLKLLHIFDFEWKDRKEQIKSFLKSAVGKNDIKIYARDTELVELTNKDQVKEFLNTYHILGSVNYIKAYGLKYNNELISLITINKHHRNNKEWILNRYITKTNINVLGGLSKLTKKALQEFKILNTWIDLRFSNGEKWLKLGWALINKSSPDYFYYNPKNGKIISKQSRKKSIVNTPQGMTETEHAKIDGLKKVHDCGKLKLQIKL